MKPTLDLVSSSLALEATELVSEPVTEMALELINNHLISVSKRDKCKSYILFSCTSVQSYRINIAESTMTMTI